MRRTMTILGVLFVVLAAAAGGAAWHYGVKLPFALSSQGSSATSILSPEAPANRFGYVLAKASPLLVYDGPDLKTGARQQAFEFGMPYEVVDADDQYIQLRLGRRETVYIRASHGTIVRRPAWLKATSAFMVADRPRIRMWESGVRLNEFLAGVNTANAQWDFEEFYDTPPKFRVALPIVERDTLDLLGGNRQVKLVSAMVPIHREAAAAFESAKVRPELQVSLHFLVDVSNSTHKFVDRAMSSFAEQLGRNDNLRNRVRAITLTTFGGPSGKLSEFVGPLPIERLRTYAWHRSNLNQPSAGDREPLTHGLLTLTSSIPEAAGAVPIFVVLSGADVMLNLGPGRSETLKGRTISGIEDLPVPTGTNTIFAQVTPEPGSELRSASQRIKSTASRYVEFSDNLGRDLLAEVARVADANANTPYTQDMFRGYADASHRRSTMALLPRVLSDKAALPARQAYAAEAEWYSVRLWVTLDNLLWREVMDRDAPDEAAVRPDAGRTPATDPSKQAAAPAGATSVRARDGEKRYRLDPPLEQRLVLGLTPANPLQQAGALLRERPAGSGPAAPLTADARKKLLSEHLERTLLLRSAAQPADTGQETLALDGIRIAPETLERNSGLLLARPSDPAVPPSAPR